MNLLFFLFCLADFSMDSIRSSFVVLGISYGPFRRLIALDESLCKALKLFLSLWVSWSPWKAPGTAGSETQICLPKAPWLGEYCFTYTLFFCFLWSSYLTFCVVGKFTSNKPLFFICFFIFKRLSFHWKEKFFHFKDLPNLGFFSKVCNMWQNEKI